jgi:hypothetical protein
MLPTGFARPLRVIITPVMKVVLTAPNPTTIIPNLPVAGLTISFAIILLQLNVYVDFNVLFCPVGDGAECLS